MEISVRLDADEVLRESFRYLHKNMQFEDFEAMCYAVFKSDSIRIRDCLALAISDIDDPQFVPVIKKAIEDEQIEDFKRDLLLVLGQLELPF